MPCLANISYNVISSEESLGNLERISINEHSNSKKSTHFYNLAKQKDAIFIGSVISNIYIYSLFAHFASANHITQSQDGACSGQIT